MNNMRKDDVTKADLNSSKNDMASLISAIRQINATTTKDKELGKSVDEISAKQPNNNDLSTEADELPVTFSKSDEAIRAQDVDIRAAYINAVKKDIKAKNKIRNKLVRFYVWFLSIVTAAVFFVVIDPIAIWRNQPSTYPNGVKYALCGAFFVNLLSIVLVMVRYSFTHVDKEMFEFKSVGAQARFERHTKNN